MQYGNQNKFLSHSDFFFEIVLSHSDGWRTTLSRPLFFDEKVNGPVIATTSLQSSTSPKTTG